MDITVRIWPTMEDCEAGTNMEEEEMISGLALPGCTMGGWLDEEGTFNPEFSLSLMCMEGVDGGITRNMFYESMDCSGDSQETVDHTSGSCYPSYNEEGVVDYYESVSWEGDYCTIDQPSI